MASKGSQSAESQGETEACGHSKTPLRNAAHDGRLDGHLAPEFVGS
jgi:hypothetical protein